MQALRQASGTHTGRFTSFGFVSFLASYCCSCLPFLFFSFLFCFVFFVLVFAILLLLLILLVFLYFFCLLFSVLFCFCFSFHMFGLLYDILTCSCCRTKYVTLSTIKLTRTQVYNNNKNIMQQKTKHYHYIHYHPQHTLPCNIIMTFILLWESYIYIYM